MKLLSKAFAEGEDGSVKVQPVEAEDLWHLYNIISNGDTVSAVTFRKVHKETSSGANESERVRLKLAVVVESVEYDNVAAILRVRGKNTTENEYVKLRAYHTLELEQNRPVTITKPCWDSVASMTLSQACDAGATADLAALVMQEGLAHLCLIGASITTVKARIETAIPRKRGAAVAGYDKALNTFFKNVLQAVVAHVDFSVVRCLIIASPGFTKDQFYEYLLLEASKQNMRVLIENKSKIMLAHSSSGFKHALKELLSSPKVMAQIKDTKAAKEVRVLEEFYKMLSTDPDRACYGPRHVEVAHEQGAIQTLLISDELFRNSDVVLRRKYVDLVEDVKKLGGGAHVFSSRHVSGEQLGLLTGVAAILRFPMPDLDELEL